MKENMIYMPVGALGDMEEGSPVEATIKGTMEMKDGMPCIAVETVNDEPVSMPEGMADDMETKAIGDKLSEKLKERDAAQMNYQEGEDEED